MEASGSSLSQKTLASASVPGTSLSENILTARRKETLNISNGASLMAFTMSTPFDEGRKINFQALLEHPTCAVRVMRDGENVIFEGAAMSAQDYMPTVQNEDYQFLFDWYIREVLDKQVKVNSFDWFYYPSNDP